MKSKVKKIFFIFLISVTVGGCSNREVSELAEGFLKIIIEEVAEEVISNMIESLSKKEETFSWLPIQLSYNREVLEEN